MSRKSRIIIIAGAAILLLNSLHIFGTSGLGEMFDVVLTIGILCRAVILVKRIGQVKVSKQANSVVRKMPAISPAGNTVQTPSTVGGLQPVWVLALGFLFIMCCFSYHIMAAAGLNFFVWGDHVFRVGKSNLAVVIWMLAGLFLGAVIGSLVIWKKYHIKWQWCLVTIVPFLSICILLQVLSDPLRYIVPRSLAVAVDSSSIKAPDSAPVMAKRRKHKITKPVRPVDTAIQSATAVTECTRQLAEVSIMARTDSVSIYYRTASYQHGPWSQWKSKLIPQQGQFTLTDEGQVKANSLQYYYETKSVFTRSAENPYTLVLCDGALVIDTY